MIIFDFIRFTKVLPIFIRMLRVDIFFQTTLLDNEIFCLLNTLEIKLQSLHLTFCWLDKSNFSNTYLIYMLSINQVRLLNIHVIQTNEYL